MTRQEPYRPSVRKRVLLALYLALPFLVLALLMWTIAYQLQKQGAEIRGHSKADVETPVYDHSSQNHTLRELETGDHRTVEDPERIRKIMQELAVPDTAPSGSPESPR